LSPQQVQQVRTTIRNQALVLFNKNQAAVPPVRTPACIVYLAGRAGQESGTLQGRGVMNSAHRALNAKLTAENLRLNERCLVDRERTVADDELAFVNSQLVNLAAAATVNLALPRALAQEIYGPLLQAVMDEVVRSGKPAVVPLNKYGHWLTLFLVKEGKDRCKAVLFDSQTNAARAAAVQLQAISAPVRKPGQPPQRSTLSGEMALASAVMQEHTTNSCGVHYQMLVSQVDRFIGTSRVAQPGGRPAPVSAQSIVDYVRMYIDEWMALSPVEQIARIDEFNMERFQGLCRGA
jgi:hypothetical protein